MVKLKAKGLGCGGWELIELGVAHGHDWSFFGLVEGAADWGF